MSCCCTQGYNSNCFDSGMQVFLYEVSQTRFARINMICFYYGQNGLTNNFTNGNYHLKTLVFFISVKLVGRQFCLCFYEPYPAVKAKHLLTISSPQALSI